MNTYIRIAESPSVAPNTPKGIVATDKVATTQIFRAQFATSVATATAREQDGT